MACSSSLEDGSVNRNGGGASSNFTCCCYHCCSGFLRCVNQATKLPCRILRLLFSLVLISIVLAIIMAALYGWNLTDITDGAKKYIVPILNNITTTTPKMSPE